MGLPHCELSGPILSVSHCRVNPIRKINSPMGKVILINEELDVTLLCLTGVGCCLRALEETLAVGQEPDFKLGG